MPEEPTSGTTRTTRSTTSVESVKTEPTELKERLSNVQNALEEIEGQVRKDAESLQRLRSMLDVSYLEEITRLIADLELRVSEVAGEADQARARAREAEDHLAEEQERLEKLWDVYKVQEAELEQTKADKLKAERAIQEANEKAERAQQELSSEKRALRQAQEEMGDVRQRLADAEARAEELSAYEALGDRVDELEGDLNEERERLAKLYAVFEETEAERDDLVARVKQWDAWFAAHRDAMKGVCKAVNEAPSE